MISSSVLPTPEKMIFCGEILAFSARAIFAARNDVSAEAKPGHQPQHGDIAVGLAGEGDQRLAVLRQRVRERFLQPRDGVADFRGAIDIGGRAVFRGDVVQGNVVGVEDAFAVCKTGAHGNQLSGLAGGGGLTVAGSG